MGKRGVTQLSYIACLGLLLVGFGYGGWGLPAYAQGEPSGNASYLLRLVVSLPREAGDRRVYAIFESKNLYQLSYESGGLYSLEAEATQSGGEIVVIRGGVEERRDRATWTAYAGLKLTVEVSYRMNELGGLELDKVEQGIGRLPRVNSTPAASGSELAPTALPATNPPTPVVKAGATGGNDSEPIWRQSPTPIPSSRDGSTTNPGASATLTAALPTTATVVTAPPPAPPPITAAANANYFNTYTAIGGLALLLALGVFLLPKLLNKMLQPTTDLDDEAEVGNEAQDDEASYGQSS